MQTYRTGVAAVLVAGVVWSLMGLMIRMLEAAGTWQVLFYRSMGLVPVLALFIAIRSGGQLATRIRQTGWPGVIGGLALVAAFAGAIFAIQSTTIANAVFLFTASPFLTAILAGLLLGEKVRGATWIAIAIAVAGVALMVREGLAGGAGWGNLAALLSALGFAVFTVVLRWGKLADMMPVVLLGALFSMAVAAGVIWLGGDAMAVSWHDGALAFAMGSVILAFGMICYTLGSRSVPAAETTLLSLVEVLLAPVWVWLVLGESASTGTFIGGGVVLLALCFNTVSGTLTRG